MVKEVGERTILVASELGRIFDEPLFLIFTLVYFFDVQYLCTSTDTPVTVLLAYGTVLTKVSSKLSKI
jgi:hypothetical protein